jgi:hypothetical protein
VLYDPLRLAVAGLGEVAPNPAFDPTPALAFAMRPAAALDARRYTHRQPFHAAPSSEGLLAVELALELLAVARADLADVRVVDAAGNQWAYLVERDAAVVTRDLPMHGPRTEEGVSRYEIALPVAPASLDALVLHAGAPYFDRAFTLEAEGVEGPAYRAGTGRLTRRRGDPRPVRIPVDGSRVTALELSVPDGDDAPLDFERAEGRFGVPRLYLPAPEGEYALLAGSPDETAPVYELERVREMVLAVAAATATPGTVDRNPDYSAAARLARGRGLHTLLLWSAIVLVVGVLAWMTLRLARE